MRMGKDRVRGARSGVLHPTYARKAFGRASGVSSLRSPRVPTLCQPLQDAKTPPNTGL
jgi:hypothetical protein